jgi:thioredoxin-like negative regulator of GroEL
VSDRVVVVVFKMEGCPACAEYMPTFKRVAARYRGLFPIYIVDAADQRYEHLATRLGVNAVPVTFILRKPTGMLKSEGALGPEELQGLLDSAAREASR